MLHRREHNWFSSSMHRSASPEEQQELVELFRRLNSARRPAATDVAQLSDLSRRLVPTLQDLWASSPLSTRRYLVSLMEEMAESNVELNFRHVFEVALHDPDPEVRAHAVSGLWEEGDPHLLDRLLDLLPNEEAEHVREAIAVALSRFSYLASIDQLDEPRARRLRHTLFTLAREDAALAVRRRAVEAIGYYGDDPDVVELIAEAYDAAEHALRVSAVYAMGRSLDRRWLPHLLAELESEEPELRYEAARACGELGAQEAVDHLIALVDDPDREVQAAAIGALGQIGGPVAINTLRRLARSADPVVREAAEEALTQAVYEADPLRPGPWP